MPKCPPNELRVLRARHRRTQYEAAEFLRIAQHRYWSIENSRTEPNERERAKLAEWFGVTEDDVFPPVQDEQVAS